MRSEQQARYLAHATSAAHWYANTQCTNQHPWGGIKNQASLGSFIYEIERGTHDCRAAVVWAQALGVVALLDLYAATPHIAAHRTFYNHALLGGRYLLTLQNLDCRAPECQGGFWEEYPDCGYSMLRDGATGCFGLAGLYRHTGETEYLERAKLFCDWFMKYGTRDDGWPYRYYNFRTREGFSMMPRFQPDGSIEPGDGHIDGDWQGAGGLCLYYTGLLSGEDKYIEEGFRPIIDTMLDLYDAHAHEPPAEGWHGTGPVTLGNDDFALIALIAAFRRWQEPRILERIEERIRAHLAWQGADGSYPNFGSTFVCGIEYLDYLRLAEEYALNGPIDEVRAALDPLSAFGLTLQERDSDDPRFYGGLYGQTSHGAGRDAIHHRSTGYSMIYYLKYASAAWPADFSAFGWEKSSR